MLFFIHGQDTFRCKEKLNEIKNKFEREVDKTGSAIMFIDGEKADINEINEASGAGSLFSKKRLIIIENIFENKNKEILKELKTYFEEQEKKQDENSNIFVIIHSGNIDKRSVLWKYLSSQKFVQEFELLSATAASAWVVERAKNKQAHISRNASLKLTALFGSDLWKLDSELNKLINYKNAKVSKLLDSVTEIKDDDIELMCRGNVDENIFAFSDAIANKNKSQAVMLLENELEAGVAPTYLMHMITRQFRILIQVRRALDDGLSQRKISTELKLHPYVVQKSIQQAGNFTEQKLKIIFSKLLKLDKELKTGQSDFKITIDLLFMKL
ncbi:DNA polymerase III subunit delta [Candidatus Parcubacteria bacterium]|nr:MAG: DNA polymerase III subunit delta [Candidatus Parcubacteria bacterium]